MGFIEYEIFKVSNNLGKAQFRQFKHGIFPELNLIPWTNFNLKLGQVPESLWISKGTVWLKWLWIVVPVNFKIPIHWQTNIYILLMKWDIKNNACHTCHLGIT